jgi:hypothetical protein
VTRLRQLVVLVAMLLTVGALVASGEANTAAKVDDSKSSGSTTESSGGTDTPETFKVGDAVKLGDWQVKVYAVTDPVQVAADSISPVDAGSRRIGVDAEVTNNSDKPAEVSSLVCFGIKDSENKSYNQAIFTDSNVKTVDGEVAPGTALRGEIYYDVPQAATGLALTFKCDLLSSGSATIQL